MTAVQYIEKKTLARRGPIDPLPPIDVKGTLLVGEQPVLDYEEGHINTGCDHVEIFPAFYNGKRAWLRRATWNPAWGYTASGTWEDILSFEEGVMLFLEHGAFAFPPPAQDA
jgi:hypothetical protein